MACGVPTAKPLTAEALADIRLTDACLADFRQLFVGRATV
jgi:hypothetical protein